VLTPDRGVSVVARVIALGRDRAWLHARSHAEGLAARSWPERRALLSFESGRTVVALGGSIRFGAGSRDLRFVAADGPSGTEQRAHARVEAELEVELRSRSGEALPATTLDLSRGGLRVRTPVVLAPGTSYGVRVHGLGDDPVAVETATVVRSAAGAASLRFDAISDAAAERLERWALARLRRAVVAAPR